MQPLANFRPTLTDANASSELGARVGSTPLAPWPISQQSGPAWLLGIGVLLCAAPVAAFLNQQQGWALGSAAFALPFVLAGIGGLKKRTEQRGTLTVYERGFSLEQGGRTTTAQWSDVESVALQEKEWLLNGTAHGWVRRLRLIVRGRTLVLPHAQPNGAEDPFGATAEALLASLCQVAQERLRGGGSLAGDKWALTSAGLRVATGATWSFGQLAAAGIYENRARVWIEGREEPVVDLPADSPNARLLLMIAAQELPDRSGQPESTAGFGRRLFTKRSGSAVIGWVLLFFGGGSLLATPIVALTEPDALGAAAIALALGLGLGLPGWGMLRGRIHIHQRGVKLQGGFGRRELLFSDTAAFDYGATRHYYNGAYTGTTHVLGFVPAGKAKKLSFTLTTHGTDEDIERLRDGVAAIVADRLYEKLAANGAVQWSTVKLTAEGIAFRPSKLLGGKQPEQVLPYSVVAHSFHDGQMSLFGEDQKKPVVTLVCAGHNFYPGLQLYFRLCGEQTRSERAGVVG